jgi:hypothetical protein
MNLKVRFIFKFKQVSAKFIRTSRTYCILRGLCLSVTGYFINASVYKLNEKRYYLNFLIVKFLFLCIVAKSKLPGILGFKMECVIKYIKNVNHSLFESYDVKFRRKRHFILSSIILATRTIMQIICY